MALPVDQLKSTNSSLNKIAVRYFYLGHWYLLIISNILRVL